MGFLFIKERDVTHMPKEPTARGSLERSPGGRRRKQLGPTFIMPAAGAALARTGGSLSAELSRLVPAELPETERGELRSSGASTAAAAPSSCGGTLGAPGRGEPEGRTQGAPSAIPPRGSQQPHRPGPTGVLRGCPSGALRLVRLQPPSAPALAPASACLVSLRFALPCRRRKEGRTQGTIEETLPPLLMPPPG